MAEQHGGSGGRYSRGCRCLLCTEAHRKRSKRRRAERYAQRVWQDGRMVAVAPGLVHGSVNTNRNWGCKCEPCYQAHLAQMADYTRKRRSHG
jgi:hypothetical protein